MIRLISFASFGLLWIALATAMGDPAVFPGPAKVFSLIASEFRSGELVTHVGATLVRVALAFVIAMCIGTAIGVFLGRQQGADRWLDAWVVIMLNIPALVTIVLCYLWIGLTEVAAIAAVAINKIPMVVVIMREGARALSHPLADMAKIFRMTPLATLRHVTLPQLAPQLAAATRTGIALIWKIVLVVEFLGRSNGVGFQIHLYFQLFDVGRVLAYAVTFVLIMLAIEWAILQPLERRANRWRDL